MSSPKSAEYYDANETIKVKQEPYNGKVMDTMRGVSLPPVEVRVSPLVSVISQIDSVLDKNLQEASKLSAQADKLRARSRFVCRLLTAALFMLVPVLITAIGSSVIHAPVADSFESLEPQSLPLVSLDELDTLAIWRNPSYYLMTYPNINFTYFWDIASTSDVFDVLDLANLAQVVAIKPPDLPVSQLAQITTLLTESYSGVVSVVY